MHCQTKMIEGKLYTITEDLTNTVEVQIEDEVYYFDSWNEALFFVNFVERYNASRRQIDRFI